MSWRLGALCGLALSGSGGAVAPGGMAFRRLPSRLQASVATESGVGFVDVHTHLVHRKFGDEADAVVLRARAAGLEHVVVNGLEPASNRLVLELCARHEPGLLLPALGIYPLDAAAPAIAAAPEVWTHDFDPPAPFDCAAEIAFIDRLAGEGKLAAVGECGLDAFYVNDPTTMAQQETVLEGLIDVAKRHDLPLILHTRKAERRVFEMLQAHDVERADFHCYGGKLKLGKRIAEAGYYLSIPSAVHRLESFQRLAKELPLERILTETDAPYMGPFKDERNEPATVPLGVQAIAHARGEDPTTVAVAIRDNFRRLFKVAD